MLYTLIYIVINVLTLVHKQPPVIIKKPVLHNSPPTPPPPPPIYIWIDYRDRHHWKEPTEDYDGDSS